MHADNSKDIIFCLPGSDCDQQQQLLARISGRPVSYFYLSPTLSLHDKTDKSSSSRAQHGCWKSDCGIMSYPQEVRERMEVKRCIIRDEIQDTILLDAFWNHPRFMPSRSEHRWDLDCKIESHPVARIVVST